MLDGVEYVIGRLKHFLQSLIEQNKAQLTETASFALQLVDKDKSLSDECKHKIKQQIENHKSSAIASFFSCSNMTDAMVETGSVIVLSLELTANLTDNFNAIFGRLSTCNTESVLYRPACWFKAVLDVKSDIENDMNDLTYFKTRVAKLTHDIGANVNFCLHPTKQNLTTAVESSLASSAGCH